MVEHRTVAPDVAGSIPVSHPKLLQPAAPRKTQSRSFIVVGPSQFCRMAAGNSMPTVEQANKLHARAIHIFLRRISGRRLLDYVAVKPRREFSLDRSQERE